ncbi:VOC family protein [Granulosicoccus sp. 3-233]|uniref:VOC family protein n=1 Tax=Granulosicoccus sp. 3-233 TaxID=3417969 RepID=UPI003D334C15
MADKRSAGRVTGIGGVFFLADKDHESLARWYEQHLGIALESWGGGVLEWKNDSAEDGGATVWNVAARDSDWFAPSRARFMINYRVDDMEALVSRLTSAGVEILEGPQYHENGVFAWIQDPEGNKIELWEPMIWDERNRRQDTQRDS